MPVTRIPKQNLTLGSLIRLCALAVALIGSMLINKANVWAKEEPSAQELFQIPASDSAPSSSESIPYAGDSELDAKILEEVAEAIADRAESNGHKMSAEERAKLSPGIAFAAKVFVRTGGWMTSKAKGLSFNNPESNQAAWLVAIVKYCVLLPASIATGTAAWFGALDLVTPLPVIAAVFSLKGRFDRNKKAHMAAGMDPALLMLRILPGTDLNKIELIQLTDADGIMQPHSLVVPVSEEKRVLGAVSVTELEAVVSESTLDEMRGMGLDSKSYKFSLIRDVMSAASDKAKAMAEKLQELNLSATVESSPLLSFYMQSENLINRARVESDYLAPQAKLNPCEWSLGGGFAFVRAGKVKANIAMAAFDLRLLQQRVCGNAVGMRTQQIPKSAWKELDQHRQTLVKEIESLKKLASAAR